MKLFDKEILSEDFDKSLIRIGHVGFWAYILFTVIFYQERLINSDAAYYTFHMINFEEVFVKHNRYISHFTQWLPIVLIKSGASLKIVMVSYSAIFGIWFYLLFLICTYLFKNIRGGLLLLLALVLTMRYKFYAGHTEITFAIAVATTLYCWISAERQKIRWQNQWISTIIVILFSCWLYIIHPIIIVPLFVMLIYNVLEKNRWFDYWNWAHIGIILFSFYMRFKYVMDDGYESNKVNLIQDFSKVFGKTEDYYVFQILQDYGAIHFNIALLVFALSIGVIITHQKYLQALYFIAASIGIVILVALSHSYLRSDLYIMIDGYLGMLGMVWGLAITKALSLTAKSSKVLALLGFMLIVCFGQIYTKHEFFAERHRLQKELMRTHIQNGNHKTLVKLDRFNWEKLWYPYEFPHETIMLSALDDQMENASIFVDYDGKEVEEYLEKDYTMLAFYQNVGLNPRFFRLPKQKYIRVDDVPWKD